MVEGQAPGADQRERSFSVHAGDTRPQRQGRQRGSAGRAYAEPGERAEPAEARTERGRDRDRRASRGGIEGAGDSAVAVVFQLSREGSGEVRYLSAKMTAT